MSISFDRAADYYDRTRGYPPDVQERVGRALLDAAGATPRSRILEMGAGTGRIALPIIRAGYPYTGIDLSPLMLEKLRAALWDLPGAMQRVTLVEGDITSLPFPDRSFDIVLTVHVYHLVSDRARAVAEGVRVLARPGVMLNGRDDVVDAAETDEVDTTWRGIVEDLGWPLPSPEERASRRTVAQEWERLGGAVDEVVGVEWASSRAPGDEVEGLAQRLWSGTWSIPDDIAGEAARRLRAWAVERYGDALHTPVPRPRRFIIERARFE